MRYMTCLIVVCMLTQSLFAFQGRQEKPKNKIIVEMEIKGFPPDKKLVVPIAPKRILGPAIGGSGGHGYCSHCLKQPIAKYSYTMSVKERGGNRYNLSVKIEALFEDEKSITVDRQFLIHGEEIIRWEIPERIQIKAYFDTSNRKVGIISLKTNRTAIAPERGRQAVCW